MSLHDSNLATLEEIKAFMVVEHDDDDDMLSLLHLSAERRFEQFTRRPLKATEVTEYFDGGKGRIFLSNYPVSSSATFTVIDTHGYADESENETIDSKYYRVYHEKGTVQKTSANAQPKIWHPGVLRWKLTYTGGWDQMDGWHSRHKPILAHSIKLLVLEWYDLGAQVLSQGTKDAVKPSKLPLPPVVAGIWEAYEPVGI